MGIKLRGLFSRRALFNISFEPSLIIVPYQSLPKTIYKLVILVGRLRPILTKIISPYHVSFLQGRHITDNIVMAQEVLHTFQKAKGYTGFLAWKIVLAKAYDKLRWSFIRNTLQEIGVQGKV